MRPLPFSCERVSTFNFTLIIYLLIQPLLSGKLSVHFCAPFGLGLFAAELVPRLISYHNAQGRTIAIRRLKLPERLRATVERRLEEYVFELFRKQAGKNRLIPVKQLLTAFRAELVGSGASL